MSITNQHHCTGKTIQGRHVNLENCPVVEASKYVADFWSIWIVRILLEEPARFSDLIEAIPTINKVTLTNKLKSLQEAGLIEKVTIDHHPAYKLTKKGRALKSTVSELTKFANKYFDQA